MARLYADENFDHPVIQMLRQLGHDVLTVQEAGKANQKVPDHEVLNSAVSDDRAVLTFNRRDFIKLHRQVPGHRGIIVCTRDPDGAGLAHRIHTALENCLDVTGQLLRINRPFSP